MHDLKLPEFKITNFREDESGVYIYSLEPVKEKPACPFCGQKNLHVKARYKRKVKDMMIYNHGVWLEINSRKFICKSCNETFTEEYDAIAKGSQITKRLADHIKTESLIKPFKEVADIYGVSNPHVRRLFDEYIEELDKNRVVTAPKILGIDEVHLHKMYCCVFVDNGNRTVLDIIPSRNKPDVIKYLKQLPNKENIKCVTIDMWRGYKSAVNEVIPGVPIVIDKFHVIKELQKYLDISRKSISNSLDKTNRINLKHARSLLLYGSENLTQAQNDKLNEIFKYYPELEMPYLFKEAFRNIYLSETRAEAEDAYDSWIDECKIVGLDVHYGEFIRTVNHWREEIFNYFDYRYTNAITESINSHIREIDSSGRGYDFEILRNKLIYGYKIGRKNMYETAEQQRKRENKGK